MYSTSKNHFIISWLLPQLALKLRLAKPVYLATPAIDMFLTYMQTKVSLPSTNGSPVIANKPRSNKYFRTAAMLIYYISQSTSLTKVRIFKDLPLYIVLGSKSQNSLHIKNSLGRHIVLIYSRK